MLGWEEHFVENLILTNRCLNVLYLPTQDACSLVMCKTESGAINCGLATAEKPNANPTLMVPRFATRAAKICRNGLPRFFFGNGSSMDRPIFFSLLISLMWCGLGATRDTCSWLKWRRFQYYLVSDFVNLFVGENSQPSPIITNTGTLIIPNLFSSGGSNKVLDKHWSQLVVNWP